MPARKIELCWKDTSEAPNDDQLLLVRWPHPQGEDGFLYDIWCGKSLHENAEKHARGVFDGAPHLQWEPQEFLLLSDLLGAIPQIEAREAAAERRGMERAAVMADAMRHNLMLEMLVERYGEEASEYASEHMGFLAAAIRAANGEREGG